VSSEHWDAWDGLQLLFPVSAFLWFNPVEFKQQWEPPICGQGSKEWCIHCERQHRRQGSSCIITESGESSSFWRM